MYATLYLLFSSVVINESLKSTLIWEGAEVLTYSMYYMVEPLKLQFMILDAVF